MSLIQRKPTPEQAKNFSMAQARQIVTEQFKHRAWIYWTDFLHSFGIGNVCFNLVRKQELFSFGQVACFLISCVLFYRSVLFIHEIVHFRTGTFRVFRFVWNLICGIPMLVPSFFYYTHLDHHRRNHYGTHLDGEYIPLASQSRAAILIYLLQPFYVPVLAILRFMVLTPLTWFLPPVRRWVFEHASSMIMDPSYVRPLPTPAVLKVWRLQEFGCLVWCWGIAFMIYRGMQPGVTEEMFARPILNGVLPLSFLLQAYLTGFVILSVNAVRTLGAHRFFNDGTESTFAEQLLDSVNYTHWPILSEIWAPVGLRFHALHHLFPALPYHNMGKAHALLMQQLPADNLYRQTNSTSLWSVLWGLWQTAKVTEQQRQQSAEVQAESRQSVAA